MENAGVTRVTNDRNKTIQHGITSGVTMVMLVLLLALSADAQLTASWFRVYGGSSEDYGKDVIATSDGGFAAVGITKSFAEPTGDIAVLKVGDIGQYEWGRTFGRNSLDNGKELVQTADGGFVVCGYAFSFGTGPGDREAVVFKIDASGERIWGNAYGGPGTDTAFDLVAMEGGGFYSAGDYEFTSTGARSTYLHRLDEDGGTVWEVIVGDDTIDERTFTGCQLSNSDLVYAGWRRVQIGLMPDFVFGAVDTSGNELWDTSFGFDGLDIIRRVRPLPTGGFIAIGETDLQFGTENEHTDLFIAKFTETGDTSWTRQVGTSGDEDCNSLEITSEGDILIGGSTRGGYSDSWDVYVVKMDTLGNLIYDWSHYTPDLEFGRGICESSPGEYVITGKTTHNTDAAGSLFLFRVFEPEPDPSERPNTKQTAGDNLIAGQSDETGLPRYTLKPVTPNPTNAGAVVTLQLPEAGHVNAVVYNSLGREVMVLNNGVMTAGTHQFALVGDNLASGVYFVRAVVPGQLDAIQRVTIVR